MSSGRGTAPEGVVIAAPATGRRRGFRPELTRDHRLCLSRTTRASSAQHTAPSRPSTRRSPGSGSPLPRGRIAATSARRRPRRKGPPPPSPRPEAASSATARPPPERAAIQGEPRRPRDHSRAPPPRVPGPPPRRPSPPSAPRRPGPPRALAGGPSAQREDADGTNRHARRRRPATAVSRARASPRRRPPAAAGGGPSGGGGGGARLGFARAAPPGATRGVD